MDREHLASIVGRLRHWLDPYVCMPEMPQRDIGAAAEAIESLVAEVDRLRTTLDAALQLGPIRSGVLVHRPGGVDVFAADHGDGE